MARVYEHKSDPGARARRGRIWLIIALGGFLVVDVVLVGLAFNAVRPVSAGQPAPIPTYTSIVTPTPTPTAPSAPLPEPIPSSTETPTP